MENLLTKRNIIIAGAIILLLIVVLIYFGGKNSGQPSTGGGVLGNLFPTSGNAPSASSQQQNTSSIPSPSANAPIVNAGQQGTTTLPIGTLIKLSADQISSLAPTKTGDVRYHKNTVENIGHLFERRADGSGDENRISNFTIPQVMKVVWSADAKRAVIFYNLNNVTRKILIDYTSTSTPKTNFLPDSLSDVVFSPDSKSMAFINDISDTQNIFVATSDFKSQRKILDNNIPDFELSWPSTNFLALKTKSSYAARGFLYTVNINSGSMTKITDGLGLDAVWNSDGSGVLYSQVGPDGQMLNLKFYDVKSGASTDMGLKTIAEKCAFLNTTKNIAFCGIPRNPDPARRYPDEWWQGATTFLDDFWMIDIKSGQAASFVPTPSDIVNPKAMSDDSYLIFKDKTSGALWSLKLKP